MRLAVELWLAYFVLAWLYATGIVMIDGSEATRRELAGAYKKALIWPIEGLKAIGKGILALVRLSKAGTLVDRILSLFRGKEK